jgi:hypothetical protein
VQGRHPPRVRTTHFPGAPRAATLVAREQRDLHRERGQLGLGQRRVPPVAEGTAPHKHRLGSTSVATHAPHTISRWRAPNAVSTVEGKWSVRQFPPPSKPASQPACVNRVGACRTHLERAYSQRPRQRGWGVRLPMQPRCTISPPLPPPAPPPLLVAGGALSVTNKGLRGAGNAHVSAHGEGSDGARRGTTMDRVTVGVMRDLKELQPSWWTGLRTVCHPETLGWMAPPRSCPQSKR